MATRLRHWRRAALSFLSTLRPFSSSSTNPENPSLYSFLQPSLFAPIQPQPQPSPKPQQNFRPKTVTPDQFSTLESSLKIAIKKGSCNEAWKALKAMTCRNSVPSKDHINSLIRLLCSGSDRASLNLKRAFAAVFYVIERRKFGLLDFGLIRLVLEKLSVAETGSEGAVFGLVKCVFKNRMYVPFEVFGDVLVEVSRRSGEFGVFLEVFEESCRVGMRPGLEACNVALEGCCRVEDAERVVELMRRMEVRMDEVSFGWLGYLYSSKGMEEKVNKLEKEMCELRFEDKMGLFWAKVVRGYVKAGDLEMVVKTVLHGLRKCGRKALKLDDDFHMEMVNGFVKKKSVQRMSNLIIEAQKLEGGSVAAERSLGYDIVNACINLGWLDKAHSILDDLNAQGVSVGAGVYVSIVRAYCQQHRTAEAAQLVMDISRSGVQLDVGTYDSLIETAISGNDFQSGFSVFRDMRETGVPDLKRSYLTIMTGLTEKQRPELMAAFLDKVASDTRIEVATHDWNSIIHAFCKAGKIEDATRTFRRMLFLQFEPNAQTYLSLINGYNTTEQYVSVLMLWNELSRHLSADDLRRIKVDHSLFDAFLCSLVKGGIFHAAMQVVKKSQEMQIYLDKWRYKQAFMETHKKLQNGQTRTKSFKKKEALIAFKNWAGLNA